MTDLEDIICKEPAKPSLKMLAEQYDRLYSKAPLAVNYLSTALGVVGGDAIAKQFTDNPNVTFRDIAFTATAAAAYSYLAPKMIEWSTKATDKASKTWSSLKDKTRHAVFNSCLLTAMYFPVNMVYWNYLTIKNQAPISVEDNMAGAMTLAIATIPYLAADYLAVTRLSQPDTVKYLRPFYSAVEVLWNTMFSGGNYLAKKF